LGNRFKNVERGTADREVLGLSQAISVAQMQGHLVLHRHDPFSAVVTADFSTQPEAATGPEADPEPEANTAAGSTSAAVPKPADKTVANQPGAAK
jgi:hypothetical protein